MEKNMEVLITKNNFKLSTVKIDQLEETEYTIVTVLIDVTGSVNAFKNDLVLMEKNVIKACKKLPKADNLIINNLIFNSAIHIKEKHGFKTLDMIDVDNDYKDLACGHMTNLFDAILDSISGLKAEAKRLQKAGYVVNTALYVITDGGDNCSRSSEMDVNNCISGIVQKESFNLTTVLIGINENDCISELEKLKDNGFELYVNCPDAKPATLAKLAGFITDSISSSSMNMPQPQNLTF